MTKHQKEKQRYYVKWVLVLLLIIEVLTGVIGYFKQLHDNTLLIYMIGETVAALIGFFSVHMLTSVRDDPKISEEHP
jgi:NhaP-type Na+/H+ and K+/H+ antiporter